jgi:hypothetical protein
MSHDDRDRPSAADHPRRRVRIEMTTTPDNPVVPRLASRLGFTYGAWSVTAAR